MGFGIKKVWNKIHARRISKKLRRKVGLTSKNKWTRQIKRSLLASSAPVSAATVSSGDGYRYQGRTLSQLTGGV